MISYIWSIELYGLSAQSYFKNISCHLDACLVKLILALHCMNFLIIIRNIDQVPTVAQIQNESVKRLDKNSENHSITSQKLKQLSEISWTRLHEWLFGAL